MGPALHLLPMAGVLLLAGGSAAATSSAADPAPRPAPVRDELPTSPGRCAVADDARFYLLPPAGPRVRVDVTPPSPPTARICPAG